MRRAAAHEHRAENPGRGFSSIEETGIPMKIGSVGKDPGGPAGGGVCQKSPLVVSLRPSITNQVD